MSIDDDPVVRVCQDAVPVRRQWPRYVIFVGVIFVGLSMTIPLVLVGGVALGWNAGGTLAYAVACCWVLYVSGALSLACDERRKP